MPRGFVIFIYYMKAFYSAREITQSVKKLLAIWGLELETKHSNTKALRRGYLEHEHWGVEQKENPWGTLASQAHFMSFRTARDLVTKAVVISASGKTPS